MVVALILGVYLLLLSNDLDRTTGELFNLFLSVVGVKYRLFPYFCVFAIILLLYYFSASSFKKAGFFG